MARQVASLFGVLRLDDSDYKNKLSSATRDTNTLGQTLQAKGQQLQQFGGAMTAFFAPVGVGLAYAVTQAHIFDRTFSNINSILQLGTDDAAALKAQLIQIGSGTVAGPQAVAEAYYEIASGVADSSTHMAILNAAIATSEAGQADLTATTSALIGVMNAYGFAASDATYVSDVLSRTVAMGVGEMSDFAQSLPAAASLASAYGVKLNELGGAMAYLTTKNIESNQAATFMNAMVTTLLNPTQELSASINSLGYESGAAMLNQLGLVGAYEALAAQNGGLDGLITNTEALRGATVLLNDGYSAFQATYDAGIAGSTARQAATQGETNAFEMLKSSFDGLALTMTETVMPALYELANTYITPLIKTVNDWMIQNPELTAQILAVTAVLVIAGPVIMGVGTVLTILGGAIGLVTGATGLLTGALGILMSPAVLLVAIFAGLAFLFNREGGIIKSLNDASTAATQLAVLGLAALNTAAQNAVNLWGQLNTIIGLVFNHEPPSWLGASFSSDTLAQMQSMAGTSTGTHGAFNNVSGTGQFGGARAGGGDVEAGKSYLVGENGPEPFVPRVNGTIIPNDKMGGTTVHVSIGSINANSEAEGRAAARGFNEEFTGLMRSKGIVVAHG